MHHHSDDDTRLSWTCNQAPSTTSLWAWLPGRGGCRTASPPTPPSCRATGSAPSPSIAPPTRTSLRLDPRTPTMLQWPMHNRASSGGPSPVSFTMICCHSLLVLRRLDWDLPIVFSFHQGSSCGCNDCISAHPVHSHLVAPQPVAWRSPQAQP